MSEYEIVNARLWVDVSPDGTDAQIGITCPHGNSRTSVMAISFIQQIGEGEVIAALCGSHRSENCQCGEKLWDNYQRKVAQRYTTATEVTEAVDEQKVITIVASSHNAGMGNGSPLPQPHALPSPASPEEA